MMSIGLLRVPKPTRGQILPPTPVPNLYLPHLREQVEAAADQYQKSKEIYAKLAEQVVLGRAINAAGTSGCIRRFSNFISREPGLAAFVLDLESTDKEYHNHGLNVVLLSLTVASYLGFTPYQILSAGRG